MARYTSAQRRAAASAMPRLSVYDELTQAQVCTWCQQTHLRPEWEARSGSSRCLAGGAFPCLYLLSARTPETKVGSEVWLIRVPGWGWLRPAPQESWRDSMLRLLPMCTRAGGAMVEGLHSTGTVGCGSGSSQGNDCLCCSMVSRCKSSAVQLHVRANCMLLLYLGLNEQECMHATFRWYQECTLQFS